MARGADGSMMTEEELYEVNKKRFLKFKKEGTLGNNGPITADGGTSMGEDRWSAFTGRFSVDDQDNEYHDGKPVERIRNMVDYKVEKKAEPEFEEILAEGDKTKIFEGDELVFAGSEADEQVQKRGLNGERDEEGNLKTEDKTKYYNSREEFDKASAENAKDFKGLKVDVNMTKEELAAPEAPEAEGMLTKPEPEKKIDPENIEMIEAITEAGLTKEESTDLLEKLKGICG